ncbi:hypothetical protein BKI52_38465 [marine bacterium AO1-C]|nr:hypothetical protein BKI52_38465 [marine bacterium AO1-C]
MKKIINQVFYWSIVSLLCIQNAIAQTRPRFSQYTVNHHLINSASTGAYGYSQLHLVARNQWLGLEDTPRALAFSGQFPLTLFSPSPAKSLPTIGTISYSNRTDRPDGYQEAPGPVPAVGFLLVLEENNRHYRRHTYFNLAIPFQVTKKITLALGGGLGLVDLRQKSDGIGFLDSKSITSPVVDGGIFVYSDDFFGGFASGKMFEEEAVLPEIPNHNQTAIYYHITGGYRWRLNANWQLIPSAQFRIVESQGANVTLSTRAVYQEKNWAGLSYQEGKAIGLLAGKVFGQIELNYAYSFPLSSVAFDRINNHEFTLKYRWRKSLYRFQHNLF